MIQRQQTFIRITQALATIALAWMSSAHLSSAEYYVAPDGNDSRTAIEAQSLATPWKTIQKAASMLVAGDTCLIRAGTYRETVTVANSGTDTTPIVFTAYNNEVVIISGTELINTGWTVEPSFGNGHVYVTTMNWSLGVENQIFVNGVMQPEAQWPNPGQEGMTYPWRNSYLKPSKDWSYVDTAGYGSDTKGWFTDAELPNRPDGYWVGSRVMMLSGLGWIMWTPSVTAYEAATKKISTSQIAYNSAYNIVSGNEFHLVGVKQEIDTPGEWFYEATTQWTFALPEPRHAARASASSMRSRISGLTGP